MWRGVALPLSIIVAALMVSAERSFQSIQDREQRTCEGLRASVVEVFGSQSAYVVMGMYIEGELEAGRPILEMIEALYGKRIHDCLTSRHDSAAVAQSEREVPGASLITYEIDGKLFYLPTTMPETDRERMLRAIAEEFHPRTSYGSH
jgi:hypothetical protein